MISTRRRIPWQKQFTVGWPKATNKLLLLVLLFLLQACMGGIRQEQPEVGVPNRPQETSSLQSLLEGLEFIRENPTEREDERVQRFLWLDSWISILQRKDRLTDELGQEFWDDLSVFVKEPPMSSRSLNLIVERAETRLGRNIAYYQLYLSALKRNSIEEALSYLRFVEPDGISDLYVRSQQLLELQVSRAIADSRKVGILLPLSGELAGFGRAVLNSIQLLSSYAISEGVEFVVEDIGTTDDELLDAFQHLVLREQVSVILGPLTSASSEFVFERSQILRVPVVSLAPRENLEFFGDFNFRSALTLRDQVSAVAQLARNGMRANRVGILYPDSNYGWDVVEIAKRMFPEVGLEISQMRVYAEGATDFKEPLKEMTRLDYPKLRADELCPDGEDATRPEGCVESLADLPPILDFEILFVPDFANSAGLMLPTLPFLKIYGVQVMGLSGYHSPRLIERGQQHAEGVVFTDGFYEKSRDIQTQLFTDRYQELAGAVPSKTAAEAYDMGMILIDIMKSYEGPITRETLSDELRRIRRFPGVTGKLYSDGQEIRKNPRFLVVRDGKFKEFE